MQRVFLCWLLLCGSLLAQQLTFGVIAGTNLTDDVRSGRQDFSGASGALIVDPGARRPILGLKIEQRLPHNWALEFNALHREWKETSNMLFNSPLPSEWFDGRTVSAWGPYTRTLTTWEFPILAKYRLPLRTLHPFVTAGPSFRPAGTGTGLSHAGIATGGGVEFMVGGFRVAPALRYTRWSSANTGLFPPLVNQLEFLVGVDRPSMTTGARAFGRRLSIGAIAGVGLGDDFKPDINSPSEVPESNSGIFGVMIEVPLPRNWAVEADGLYRPLHGTEDEFGRPVRFAHLTWEFPVLAKHRFALESPLRPFVEAGPSFRAEGNLNLQRTSHYGATLGLGLERKLGPVKISPVARYTRWGAGNGSTGGGRTFQNQVQLLVSFAY